MNNPALLFRVHAIQRMFERNISAKKVTEAIRSGETVEDYSSEMHQPSRLILAFQGRRPFHTVTSENPGTNEITIITVYIPHPAQWKKDFKSRRA
jgi:hypothetical protein